MDGLLVFVEDALSRDSSGSVPVFKEKGFPLLFDFITRGIHANLQDGFFPTQDEEDLLVLQDENVLIGFNRNAKHFIEEGHAGGVLVVLRLLHSAGIVFVQSSLHSSSAIEISRSVLGFLRGLLSATFHWSRHWFLLDFQEDRRVVFNKLFSWGLGGLGYGEGIDLGDGQSPC